MDTRENRRNLGRIGRLLEPAPRVVATAEAFNAHLETIHDAVAALRIETEEPTEPEGKGTVTERDVLGNTAATDSTEAE